jgi:hypothetical protein
VAQFEFDCWQHYYELPKRGMDELPHPNRPPVQLQGRAHNPYQKSRRNSSGGFFRSFLGVFFGLLAVIGVLWAIAFYAHIQREQRVIDGLKARIAEITKVPANALSDADLASQSTEIPQLIALDGAAHQSQYDPLWFINGAP